jgi:hypothetical protein
MRKLMTAATASVALFAAAASYAATPMHATGSIKSISAQTLVLNNGDTYMLPAKFKTAGLKVGERVRVTYEQQGGKAMASQVVKD